MNDKRIAGLRGAKLRPVAPCGRKCIFQNELRPANRGAMDFAQKPAAERKGLRRRGAALRRGAAAGCGGSIRNRKLKIQNEKLRMNRCTQCFVFGLQPAEDASDDKELRASAAGRLRPARS